MIHLILVLAIFGFLAWLVLQIPMPELFKKVLYGVFILIFVLWLLQFMGVDTGFGRLRL